MGIYRKDLASDIRRALTRSNDLDKLTASVLKLLDAELAKEKAIQVDLGRKLTALENELKYEYMEADIEPHPTGIFTIPASEANLANSRLRKLIEINPNNYTKIKFKLL